MNDLQRALHRDIHDFFLTWRRRWGLGLDTQILLLRSVMLRSRVAACTPYVMWAETHNMSRGLPRAEFMPYCVNDEILELCKACESLTAYMPSHVQFR